MTTSQPIHSNVKNPDATARTPGIDIPVVDQDRVKTLAKVIYDEDFTRSRNNKVYLSSESYRELFGDEAQVEKFVSIANRVFPAVVDTSLDGKQIGVSQVQYGQIGHAFNENDRGETIVVRPFESDQHLISFIQSVRFRVETAGTINQMRGAGNKPAILLNSLIRLAREQLGEQIVSLGQEFFIKHPVVGPLKLVLEQWDFVTDEPREELSDDPLPYYGSLTSYTEMDLTVGRGENLAIVKEVEPEKLQTFAFTITKVENISKRAFSSVRPSHSSAWKNRTEPLPLQLPLRVVSRKIREKLQGKLIFPEHQVALAHSEDWQFIVKLAKVTLKKGAKESSGAEDIDNQTGFRLGDKHRIRVTPNTDVILTRSSSHQVVAESVTFEVIDKDLKYEKGLNEINWLSVRQIIKDIRENHSVFAIGSKFLVQLDQGKFLLEVKKAFAETSRKPKKGRLKRTWTLDDTSQVKVFARPSLNLEMIESPKPYSIETMKVVVDIAKSRMPGGIFAILGGKQEKAKKIKLSQEEIEKLFKQALPLDLVLIKDQELTVISDKGKLVNFTIKEVKSDMARSQESEYKVLYSITEDTEVTFLTEKDGGLMISRKPVDISYEDIGNKLKEYGIGGMSDQFKDIITKIILTRTKYAAHAEKLGQKPPRGILLYGPPGTGKTILARKLGEILGVSEENTQLITGSNVWSKWLGDSEENVRKLFAAAREDQETYGKDSPLHLIIIDEIDAFLQSRERATQRYESSVLTTFLAELDGISGQGGTSLDNVVVVGLTNYPEKLDDAVVRPGRLGTQIHIGMPDAKGRKEIFEIHSRRVQESDLLSDDVDFDEIAKMTIGRTGAFIEGMVRVASEYSTKRLFEQQIDIEAEPHHPAAKVGMQDFVQAFQVCAYKEKAVKAMQKKFIPEERVSLASLQKDLARLGIVGVPKNVIDAIFELKLRQVNKKLLLKIGHPFPQGLFLYGPARTGKTKIAKAMKELFELDGDRFQYYSASELFPLKPQALKEKIEKIVKPAKDAANDLKEDAPLHIVVIDEIDWMYWMSREKQQDTSLLNKFLKELEVFLDGESEDLHNLLVVGVARRSRKLPHAILSHGRFGNHVAVEFPGYKERQEILAHYLRSASVEEGVIDEMASKTKDRSPGFIEGLVGEAEIFMLKEGKDQLTLSHFEDAYRKMTRDEPDRNYLL